MCAHHEEQQSQGPCSGPQWERPPSRQWSLTNATGMPAVTERCPASDQGGRQEARELVRSKHWRSFSLLGALTASSEICCEDAEGGQEAGQAGGRSSELLWFYCGERCYLRPGQVIGRGEPRAPRYCAINGRKGTELSLTSAQWHPHRIAHSSAALLLCVGRAWAACCAGGVPWC